MRGGKQADSNKHKGGNIYWWKATGHLKGEMEKGKAEKQKRKGTSLI